MSITINQYPIGGTYVTMAHDPVEYAVESNNTAQSNFKYVADFYYDGATFPIRFLQGAEPSNGYCRFDFSSITRSLVSFNPPTYFTNDFTDCTDSYKLCTIKFGEQYGASSAITVYPDLEIDSIFVWNASLPTSSFFNSTNPITKYIVGTDSSKFLTNIPMSQDIKVKICSNDFYYLYFLQDNTIDPVGYVEINLYRADGALQGFLKWDSSYPATSIVQKIGCGTYNIQLSGAELNFNSNLSAPYIDSETAYYTVRLFDNKGTPFTEEFYFEIDCQCAWETPYRLCFLNNWGGYDFFTFNWNSKKTSSYQKSFYEKKGWSWTGANTIYNSYDRGKVQYSTIGTDKLQLTSGWITQLESTWLEELVSSPDVYIIDGSGSLTAVTVTDMQYDYKTLEYDQLFNLTITLEFAHNRFRQSL